MEMLFFTLYNRSCHPFRKIIISDDIMDSEEVNKSFWTDNIPFLRIWNNIKNAVHMPTEWLRMWNNIKNSVHMTTELPKMFCNQSEISKSQEIYTFSQNVAVNGEPDIQLKGISELQLSGNKNSTNDGTFSELIINSVDQDKTNESMTIAQNVSTFKETAKIVKGDDNDCTGNKQMKEWHLLTSMVFITLLLGMFTGIAIIFGLGLNTQIGKSSFYLKKKHYSCLSSLRKAFAFEMYPQLLIISK